MRDGGRCRATLPLVWGRGTRYPRSPQAVGYLGTPVVLVGLLVVGAQWRTEHQVGFAGTHEEHRGPDASIDAEVSPERDAPSPEKPIPLGALTDGNGSWARPSEVRASTAWNWFAAERIAVAVVGCSAADLDAAHAILIHLYEKVPTSRVVAAALDRGVSFEDLWQDDRFISAVWTIAANKLTDLRRAATRRRSPKFRRPSSAESDPDGWHRYPPHFRLVSADSSTSGGDDPPGSEVADDGSIPELHAVAAELATVSRAIVRRAIAQMRPTDAAVITFVYGEYIPEVHGPRVDEALATHLSARAVRPVSRDAARRRLSDARVRLEDTIVAAHRHALLDLVARLPDVPSPTPQQSVRGAPPRETGASISLVTRTALVTYLSIVGTRPRDAVLEATYATVDQTLGLASTPWRDRREFAAMLLMHVRALFVRHETHLGHAVTRAGDDHR